MAEWDTLLGARPLILQVGMARYTWFEEHYRGKDPETDEEAEQYARGFLLFLFGTTLFSNRWNTVGLYFLGALVVLQRVHFYDWGAAGLTTLYGYMSSTSWMCGRLIGGYWRAWEVHSLVSPFHYLLTISCFCFIQHLYFLHFLYLLLHCMLSALHFLYTIHTAHCIPYTAHTKSNIYSRPALLMHCTASCFLHDLYSVHTLY